MSNNKQSFKSLKGSESKGKFDSMKKHKVSEFMGS